MESLLHFVRFWNNTFPCFLGKMATTLSEECVMDNMGEEANKLLLYEKQLEKDKEMGLYNMDGAFEN